LAPIPLALPPGGTTVIDGVTYNNRGYEVCGALNKFNKPCQRIGRCPFHPEHKKTDAPPAPHESHASVASTAVILDQRRFLPIKKGPYKSGWKKDEHLRFLKGLQIHGRGSWKDISLIVGTRTPTQIQVHAHRYYLRQQQGTKNKRSIHDISLEDLEELEVQHGSIMPVPHSPLPQLPPPSPDNESPAHDITHLFQSHHPPHSFPHHTSHHTSANGHSSMNGNGHLHSHSHSHSHTSSPPSHSSSSSSSFSGSTSASTNFPPLFSGSSSSSSLPGLLPLPLPMPGGGSAPFSMTYHPSSAWFNTSPFPTMSSLSSINMGDDNLAGLHLPPPADHKLLSPLAPSFSHDDYEDDDEITDSDFTVAHHHRKHSGDEGGNEADD